MRGLGLFSLIVAATLVSTTAFAKSDHPIGVWGGEHAGVDFEGGLSDVQFDCASGTIDDAVYPARDGSFSVKGTYRTGADRPGQGGSVLRQPGSGLFGPGRQGTTKKGAATDDAERDIRGRVLAGPFTLTEGMPPQLTRCR